MFASFQPARPLFICIWLASACLATDRVQQTAATAEPATPRLQRFEFTQRHMGVDFKLTFYAPEAGPANRAAEAAFARVAELNARLSDYDLASELSRLSDTAGQARWVPVSEDLWHVLNVAKQQAAVSQGAFDVTVGPLVRLWRRALRQGEIPSEKRLQAALRATGDAYLQLDPATKSVRLEAAEMRLDLGGIAKGYAADEALAILTRHGFERAVVDASGDIAIGAPPPGETGWRIGVAPLELNALPSRYLMLSHVGVATSGDAWQFVEIAGTRYSHIVDPSTGFGLTTRSSVTVIAPDGITADSLASAVSVLGPEAGLELMESLPHVTGCIVWETAAGVQTAITSDLTKLAAAPASDE